MRNIFKEDLDMTNRNKTFKKLSKLGRKIERWKFMKSVSDKSLKLFEGLLTLSQTKIFDYTDEQNKILDNISKDYERSKK